MKVGWISFGSTSLPCRVSTSAGPVVVGLGVVAGQLGQLVAARLDDVDAGLLVQRVAQRRPAARAP